VSYDEPKILSSQLNQICLKGADPAHSNGRVGDFQSLEVTFFEPSVQEWLACEFNVYLLQKRVVTKSTCAPVSWPVLGFEVTVHPSERVGWTSDCGIKKIRFADIDGPRPCQREGYCDKLAHCRS